MKALVIDDSYVASKLIKGILLGSCGFTEVVLMENGSIGLQELLEKHKTYDLVVLDWYMPVMDGIEVLLTLRNAGISIPVIICTTADDKESIINAITAGANDYLIKPFDAGTMQAKVTHTLKAYKSLLKKPHRKKVLVIDDSRFIRLTIKNILLNDVRVDEIVFAEDGISALKIFRKEKFNLILLDWEMPGMDGLKVLNEIRKTDSVTPVIMATGNTEIEHMVSAFDAGATNFIPKPFKEEDFIKMVSQQLLVSD